MLSKNKELYILSPSCQAEAFRLIPAAYKALLSGPQTYKALAKHLNLKKNNATIPIIHYILAKKGDVYKDAKAMLFADSMFDNSGDYLRNPYDTVVQLTLEGTARAKVQAF